MDRPSKDHLRFSPLGFWQISKFQNQQVDKAVILTLLTSSAWLLWYKPAVNSLWFEWQPSVWLLQLLFSASFGCRKKSGLNSASVSFFC